MLNAMRLIKSLFSVALLLTTGEAGNTRRGTIVTVPNRLAPGKNTAICIVFSGDIKNASVTYKLTSPESENSTLLIPEQRFKMSSGGVTCVNMSLPKEYSQEVVNFGAEVKAQDYKFSETKKLGVFTEGNEFTLIQTDKPVYKPGQAVKIRLMTLNTQLLPVLDQKYDVWITDPSGVRIEQWLDVPTTKGFAQLELMLNTEPPLGKWNITCHASKRTEKAYFLVQEYVLPRFEVNIKAPGSISLDDEFITGEVCASYTYGQPVKGMAGIFIAVKSSRTSDDFPQEREETWTVEMEINGCQAFNLSVLQLGLQNTTDLDHLRQLEISASVTEQGTDVKLNASSVTVKITHLRATIAIIGNDMYKPGLDYSGKVKVTKGDGRPLAEQSIEIVVRDERSETPLRMTYLTNESGEVTYTLPTPGGFIHQYVTETTLLTGKTIHDWQRPRATKRIDPWYSPSGSYLQLQTPSAISRLPCGQEAKIDLHYTTNESQEVNLTLQVAGLNDIVLSSSSKIVLIPQLPITWASTGQSTNEDGRSTTELSRSSYSIRGRQASKNVRASHRGHTTLSINVTSAMAPVARLLVFYARVDGEIVADALSFDVEKCVPNNVTMSFTKRRVRPGEEVSLQLTAAPKSLCAYETVDKSVYLIDRGNQINTERLYGRLEQYMNSPETDINTEQGELQHCERQFIKTSNGSSNGSLTGDSSTRRTLNSRWRPYSSLYKDSSHAFELGATAVLTDLTIGTRPCIQNYRNGIPVLPMAHYIPETENPDDDADGIDSKLGTKNIVNVRTHFPETWLWDLITIGERGEEHCALTVPHTITKWEGIATCVHETRGFGVSQVAAVTVFQPFFVSVKLPYAVVRDESVPIIATVYNYHAAPLLVELTLKNSSDFTISSWPSHTVLCICSKSSKSHQYTIVPNKIGSVNITIKSVGSMNVSDCRNHCNVSSNHSEVVAFRDSVVKQLLVQPEGLPREYTDSSFVCLRPGLPSKPPSSYSLPLPKDLVPQSQRAYLSVIGDVMGPSLSNLENLLQMPWGCGEQNMLGFAPNIFVMQYLEKTGQASDAIRSKAVGYMKSGYQRQLTYSHPDRSYSAFGTSDPEGSIWLTAFVVKCFAQARQFIYIDNSHLTASIRYFSQHQTSNGCFREVGKVIHKDMKGGLVDTPNSQSTATLTAYIVISLLEANAQEQEMIMKAFRCLDKENVSDAYSVALFSYAYSLYGKNSTRTKELVTRLQDMVNRHDGELNWSAGNKVAKPKQSNMYEPQHRQFTAVEVETTAYALLAILKQKDGVKHSIQIVRWLTKQRNPYGGFVSTQDTVLAIQALARFAAETYFDVNMTTRFRHGNKTGAFNVNSRNNLQLQSTSLDLMQSKRTQLEVSFSGSGCALVQVNVRYNVKLNVTLRSAFETRVQICPSAGAGTKPKGCKQQRLAVCTRYNGADTASNMAIVEVNMVSGWMAEKDSIRLLQSNKALGLKRFEINERTVYFYFEQITKELKCFQFEVTQEQDVKHTKSVAVTTYDYYNPDMRHETNYNLNTNNCPTICVG